jgi:hypothetical protein
MQLQNTIAIRPHFINAGGIFKAMLKGAIQPLSCVLLVPFSLLFPSLVSAYLYHVFKNQNGKILSFKQGLFESFDLKAVVASEIAYIIFIFALFKFYIYKAAEYLEVYKVKASVNKVLQIGTPEQIEYSHNLTTLICYLSIAVIVFNFVVYAYTMIKCHDLSSIETTVNPLKTAFRTVKINFIGYLLALITVIFVFCVIETYYARLKLMYLEAYILKTDGFDPTVAFLAIRFLVIHMFVYGLNLFTYDALGLNVKGKDKA